MSDKKEIPKDERKGNARKTSLEQAQEEWLKQMRRHTAFSEDIPAGDSFQEENVSKLVKERSKGRKKRRSRLVKEVKKKGGRKALYGKTDTGMGIRFARENVQPFVEKTGDAVRWTAAMAMLHDFRSDKSFKESYERIRDMKDSEGKKIFHNTDLSQLSMKDIRRMRKEGVKALKEMGICDIKTTNPILLLIKLKKLKKQGKFNTEEAKAVYEVLKKAALAEAVHGRQPPRLVRFTKRKISKELEKDDTGKVISDTGRAAHHGWKLIKKMIRLKEEEYFSSKIILRQNRIRTLEERILEKGSTQPKVIKQPAKKPVSKEKGIHRIFKKRNSSHKPGRLRKKTGNMVKTAGKKVKQLSSVLFDKASVVKYFVASFGVVLLFSLILILVLGTAAVITDAVNFDSKSDQTKELCFKTIRECYEEQVNILANYNSSGYYSNVVIEEKDLKTNEAYKVELPYTETTNITEMISMAIIYFEGDLSGASEEELTSYLKGLYHGSHVITASDDGTGSVTLTVTTYYFDDLFDVAVSDWQSNGSVISGTRIDIPQSFTQVMTYEPFNYENLTGEHYWNYDCRKMWRTWTDQGQKAEDGLCYIEAGGTKFYLVAVYEPTFGKVGDYIDFYFPENDYVMHCIIADTKGADEALFKASDGKIYGHRTGPSSCSVIEFMLKYQSRGHAGSFTKGYGGPGHPGWHPEMGGNALYAVNGGSFFISPGGPVFSYTEVAGSSVEEYLAKLSEISAFIKTHGSLFTKGRGKNCTYKEMIRRVSAGNGGIYIDCGTPSSWALQSMGLISSSVYIHGGRISGGASALIRSGKVKKITDGDVAGRTIRDASNAGKLNPGDILLCGGAADHTVTYAGKDADGHPVCFDGGGFANGKGYSHVGCGPLNYSSQTQYRIRAVLRWK